MGLKAISNHVIFVFEDELRMKSVDSENKKRHFVEKTTSGIEIISTADTLDTPRWGFVVATGPRCDEAIQTGMLILIEPLKWTNGAQVGEDWFWRTNDENVMAIDDDFKMGKSKRV